MHKTQDSKRRHFSPHEKVAVVKRHLLERVPISAICEEQKISPNMFYRWPQERFETAYLSFETDRKSKAIEATKDRRIASKPSLSRLGSFFVLCSKFKRWSDGLARQLWKT
ncbi:MAG: transposase [Planctomycetota bacterium]